jgi:hypothetical protein
MTGTQHPVKRDATLTVITAVIAIAATVFAVIAAMYVFGG